MSIEVLVICFVDKGPVFRIPLEGTFVPIGEVTEMDNRCGSGSFFYFRYRGIAGLNAIKPIAMVSGRNGESLLVVAQWSFD